LCTDADNDTSDDLFVKPVEILPHDFLDFTADGEPSFFIPLPLKEKEQERFLNPKPPSA
jgi:hypothetical protein